MTKTIQQMPDIWDHLLFFTSTSTVLGELASWAVQQSPYDFPEDLTKGLEEFAAEFAPDDYFETSCEQLRSEVRATIDRCPAILSWNNSKIGDSKIVFCSRYEQPKPDYDFIDLDALSRNIAHSVTLSEKFSKLHD